MDSERDAVVLAATNTSVLVPFLFAMTMPGEGSFMKRKVYFGSWFEGTVPHPAWLKGRTRLGPLGNEEGQTNTGKPDLERWAPDGGRLSVFMEMGYCMQMNKG